MAEKQKKLLSELEFRLRQLIYLCDSLKKENQSLKAQLEEKNEDLTSIQDQLEQLETKYNNLKFAKTLVGGNNQGVEDAKKQLSKLVQDVDKCIMLLKK